MIASRNGEHREPEDERSDACQRTEPPVVAGPVLGQRRDLEQRKDDAEDADGVEQPELRDRRPGEQEQAGHGRRRDLEHIKCSPAPRVPSQQCEGAERGRHQKCRAEDDTQRSKGRRRQCEQQQPGPEPNEPLRRERQASMRCRHRRAVASARVSCARPATASSGVIFGPGTGTTVTRWLDQPRKAQMVMKVAPARDPVASQSRSVSVSQSPLTKCPPRMSNLSSSHSMFS